MGKFLESNCTDTTIAIEIGLTAGKIDDYINRLHFQELLEKSKEIADLQEKNVKLLKQAHKNDLYLETKKAIQEQARKAGLSKQSPYEKAGTIKAVNELLEEKQALLVKCGGKAALNKMILDLIATGDISAPSTPSTKTVDIMDRCV